MPRLCRLIILTVWVASFAGVVRAAAPATLPAAPATPVKTYTPLQSPTDTMAIPTPESPASPAAGQDTGAESKASARSVGFDLSRMAIALTIVLAMIFGARWMFSRLFAGSRAPISSRAIKVLGRTSLAPRQQVLLLQVGRRVVVVGESNGNLTTLAQLEDPDEVAQLIGQLQQEQIGRAAAFGGLFGRAERKFADDQATAESEASPSSPDQPDEVEAHARSELSGLMEKVKSIRNQLGRDA